MTMEWSALWRLGWPLWVLLIGAFLSLMASVLHRPRAFRAAGLVATLTFGLAAYGFFQQVLQGRPVHILNLLVFDYLGQTLGWILSLIGLVSVILSYRYWTEREETLYETIPLMVFAAFGMCLMVSTTHLITLVLALELMSLSLYVLVGTRRLDPAAGEAALKYFLLGSVSAAFMLFGISFLYGATGALDLSVFSRLIVSPYGALLFQLGVLLLLLGFAFKVAAVPFHFWAPDAYEGAPAPVTGFMATGVKVAAFGALLRVLQVLIQWEALPLGKLLLGLSLATMVVGNLTALRQRSLKRIMAYSSIAHAGYLLLGLAALVQVRSLDTQSVGPILFYLTVYGLLTLGTFGILTALCRGDREIGDLDDLNGLAERHPALAAALSIFLISLAGIPPTAGFFAKYLLFGLAIQAGLIPYAVLGILASAVSLYYYLGPVVRMYFKEASEKTLYPQMGIGVRLVLALLVLGVFYLGIFPGKALELFGGNPSPPVEQSANLR